MLENWTEKKKKLEQCHQYILFEQSARQVRLWKCKISTEILTETLLNREKLREIFSQWDDML